MNPAIYFLSSIRSSGYTYVPTEVTIGTQVWDQKNLDTAYYSDGTLIPNNVTSWQSSTNGAWRYHSDNSANGPLYGRLYNNFAYQGKFDGTTNRNSVAPAGWRVSTAADFTTLNSYLSTVQGGKMKETGLTYWNTPNLNATNSSGFSGRGSAAKLASDNTSFSAIKNTCFIWTETNTGVRLDWNTDTLVFETGLDNRRGSAIRLIKLKVNLTTTAISGQTSSQLVSGSNVTSTETLTLSERGICYSTTTAPTILNSKVIASSTGTGSIAATITPLPPLTTYYIRAYAITTIGSVFYGNEVSGATTAPVVDLTTTAVTVVGVTSLDSGGNITNDGGYAVTARGVCWSTSPNPTKGASNFTTNGSGTGSFTSNITGLNGGRLYYVRAYAITVNGTYYGAQQFNTTTAPDISITTGAYSNVSTLSVEGAATAFTDDPTYPITEVGFCWGTSTTPTRIGSSYKANGSVATFSGLNSGNLLSPGITYYIRAYAYSSSVNYTVYGAAVGPFTTLSATPTVTTNAVTAFNAQSITAGGSVTLTNGIPVLDKGLCWDLYPTVPVKVDGKFVSAGAGEGTFSGTLITGLTFGQRYNILAYSTNGYGAGLYYASNIIDQTTYTPNILIETVTDTNPFPLSMTCGGNGIVDDAAYPITEKGYCYSSSVNPPTIVNTKVLASPQTGTVSFTANTGNMLTPNVSYYVRAYALNSTTGFVDYGSTVTVLTPNDNATATIPVINNVTQSTADVAYSIGAGTYYTTGTRGICYTIAPIVPTIANGTVFSVVSPPGALAGSFTITLDPLVPFTQYNFKSFITNSAGTVYSQMSTATTLFAPVIKNAYSLRKVVPGYTGSAIRCRNAAGSSANIPFNTDGSLNTVALLTHTGVSASSQGTVETWYDQSGTNNMTIAVVSRPCYIVLNGVLQIKNNKPAIFWNAATIAYFRTLTTGSWQVNNLSIFMVSSTTSTAEVQYGLQLGNMIFPRPNTITDFIKYSASNTAITLGTSSTAIKLDSTLTTSTNISAWRNNGSVVIFTGTDTTTATVLNFGANLGTGNNKFSGTIQELIIYAGNVDGDLNTFTTRNTISSEIMGYYNIT